MSPDIRRAITVDARVKPNYAGIRVPVLAMYQAQRPFEEEAAGFDIRNEQERAALRQQYAATRAMYTRWQQDLLAAIPSARIIELPGANLFMFLSNEADVLREIEDSPPPSDEMLTRRTGEAKIEPCIAVCCQSRVWRGSASC